MSPQQFIAHYRIVGKLGEGGMGTVYRATDTRLNRDVAIKVLPDALANDPAYVARFTREAQVLAALNHPNIAILHGIEDRALVMELVPGLTLEERIAEGPIPLDEALGIARQIADALEAAHEKGIIHRDLKPANVKVTPDGVVKVLDFGLAKTSELKMNASATISPTLTIRATQVGVILGTAGYMSPEQAAGKPVDRRADIWAFGVVLFELLTGCRLFDGETVSHTLADVLRSPIELGRLPKDTPPAIRNLAGRCLDRNLRDRLRDIGEARVAIQKYLADPSSGTPIQPPPATAYPSRIPWIVAACAIAVALVLGFVAYRNRIGESTAATWLSLAPPKPGASFEAFRGSGEALSPDGRHIVFSATVDGRVSLWLRDLDSANSRVISDGGTPAFWSPDGHFVGFDRAGKLWKLALAGGPPTPICDVVGFLGASWNRDDVILFSSSGGGLQRVPASGGTPVRVTELDKSRGEDTHRYPWFLPDGRHFLYTARAAERDKSWIFAADLASSDRKPLLQVASNAVYSPPGYLMFARGGTLMAQPFDARKLQITGQAIPIAQGVSYSSLGVSADFTVSESGVLAFLSGGATNAQLTWYDASGRQLGIVGAPGNLEVASLSPDESTVVSVRTDPQTGLADLWIHTLGLHTPGLDTPGHPSLPSHDTRLTFTGTNRYPVWSPDGQRIAFASARDGVRRIYQKATGGTVREGVLEDSNRLPQDWSHDGRYLITATGSQTGSTGNDIWALPLFGDRKSFPVANTKYSEFFAKLSPDGKWLAYNSDETTRAEIYVVSFPDPGDKYLVSSEGGSRPAWSYDGRQLFYLSADAKMMAVEIRPGPAFHAGVPKPLFDVRIALGNTNYAVSKDGRFLIPSLVDHSSQPMTVVLNWPAILKK